MKMKKIALAAVVIVSVSQAVHGSETPWADFLAEEAKIAEKPPAATLPTPPALKPLQPPPVWPLPAPPATTLPTPPKPEQPQRTFGQEIGGEFARAGLGVTTKAVEGGVEIGKEALIQYMKAAPARAKAKRRREKEKKRKKREIAEAREAVQAGNDEDHEMFLDKFAELYSKFVKNQKKRATVARDSELSRGVKAEKLKDLKEDELELRDDAKKLRGEILELERVAKGLSKDAKFAAGRAKARIRLRGRTLSTAEGKFFSNPRRYKYRARR